MKETLKSLYERLFSSNYQIQRLIVILAVILVLGMISFGSYYYFDRYYIIEQPIAQKNLAEAEQAVRDNPQDLTARLDLADAYMFAGRWDEAITQANQVTAIEPDNQGAWLVVGISNANNGKPAGAIEPLTKFVDARKDGDMPGLDRSLQAAAYYLGESFLQLNMPQEAIAPLEMAVNWSRTDADAMYKLGVAYAAVKDYPKALNMFHAATTFVPNYIEAYQAMATIYLTTGEVARANYASGMVDFSNKNYEAALDSLTKSALADPEFAPVFVGLGMTYEAMGDFQNAIGNFEAAALLDPNNFTARNGIIRVDALLNK